MHDNTKGALLMMGSMAGYTFNDACMKLLSPDMPLFQAIFLRGFGVCIVFAAIILFRRQRIGAIGRRDIGFVSLRALCEAAATYLFLSALFRMPIANATAIIQALPLTVTLAGAVFLGEKVGWRRWLAIVAGFAGILLIVRPSTEGFDTASLYALCAVGVITARDLLTRQLSPAVPSLHVAVVVTAIEDGGIEVEYEGAKSFIRRSDLSRDRAEQRPDRFSVGDKVDVRVTNVDAKTRKLGLSIKAREIAEEKEAVEQYGSSDSGASLGDILGAALSKDDE